MKKFFNREWNPCEQKLATAAAFLLGIVLGFMFSPIKKGIYCGNNNGNTLPEKPAE